MTMPMEVQTLSQHPKAAEALQRLSPKAQNHLHTPSQEVPCRLASKGPHWGNNAEETCGARLQIAQTVLD